MTAVSYAGITMPDEGEVAQMEAMFTMMANDNGTGEDGS
jgi:hypothetical protein